MILTGRPNDMSSQPHHQPLGITAPVPVPVHEDDRLAKLKRRIKEKRGPLMVAAMFLACAAHRSALNPPGGYWKHGRDAGTPVMANYENFRMLTSMAFFTSLALLVLLSCDRFYRTWERTWQGCSSSLSSTPAASPLPT
ncbi:uncharacterized protein [Triticum aestivum]|uniref:uncharacterized protein isoform X2 n=1 Tax=Triticum aestivum TaxID=4565 RepID=UPI001D015D16|nr:uncharacterized protein LOC123169586 isoform X2 [Triticum aestivum]